jgi:spore germination protein GerM
VFVDIPQRYAPQTQSATAPAARPTVDPLGRKIKARLFYVTETGTALAGIEREVPFADGAAEQARAIINAQLEPVTEPLVSAVPPGTTLRALFITEGGEAYVDFSREMAATHPGGLLNEMLTIYTVVDALTVNLPAVSAVQILIDGKEVDTLAGHVDLRRPLVQNLSWIETPQESSVDSRE